MLVVKLLKAVADEVKLPALWVHKHKIERRYKSISNIGDNAR